MTTEISIDEYRRLTKAAPKYGNEREKESPFDSQAEARRYEELRLLEQAGEIHGLQVHPRYVLQEAFTTYRGENIRAITYEGDFSYTERGRAVVEDVKGVQTEVFKLKLKLFQFRYPDILFRIVEV